MKFLVVNGPNLNMLGIREPEIYGVDTLDEINNALIEYSKKLGDDIELDFYQSNIEGEIVGEIQRADSYSGIIINPAAYTHTSVAIADAIRTVNLPTVEVHLTNVQARESFRKISYITPTAIGVISGFGADVYKMALFGLYNRLKNE